VDKEVEDSKPIAKKYKVKEATMLSLVVEKESVAGPVVEAVPVQPGVQAKPVVESQWRPQLWLSSK
jgi:hypothetical protein